ncbi:MAG: hypothetical protein K2X28_01380 [Alphaproteobacteria bacterium]|nr:hypothetical protein [Alphaproteobacteria bacterium]
MTLQNMIVEERDSSQRSISPVTVHSDNEQVAVIRKEFVLLTGDPFSAVVLNQLLYWTLRVKDFDLFLEEEKVFGSNIQDHPVHPESNESSQYGWIYKTATDLSEETLLGISKTTMRKYLKVLIDQGWVEERANTLEKWKKTTQYRVNIRKLHADLMNIGRQLPGVYLKAFSAALWAKQLPKHLKAVPSSNDATDLKNQPKNEEASKIKNLSSESKILSSKIEILSSKAKILPSKTENLSSESKILSPKTKILPSYTYTENTTEITNREHTQRTRAREEKDFFEEVLGIWKSCAPQERPAHLTNERKQRLHSVLALHFRNDLTQWQRFCERIAQSPFLMGQGPRKWRISLDWILVEENLIKVLEGNFDDPTGIDQKQTSTSNTERIKEISTTLASIKDPVWREWCSQLDFDSRNAISLGELKSIANARFLEVEGDRLVWIGSSNLQVLSRIEDLRLKILPLTQRTFPKVRNLRTRLCEDHSTLQKEIPQQLGELS